MENIFDLVFRISVALSMVSMATAILMVCIAVIVGVWRLMNDER